MYKIVFEDKTIPDETTRRIVMRKSSGKDKFKWIQTKAFYGVVMSLLLAITGIGSAIYNVAKVRDMLPDNQGDEPATIFSIPETTEKNTQSQANANVTNVPDDREQSQTTLNDLDRKSVV